MMVDELSTRRLDLAPTVRFGVIRLAFSERHALGHLLRLVRGDLLSYEANERGSAGSPELVEVKGV